MNIRFIQVSALTLLGAIITSPTLAFTGTPAEQMATIKVINTSKVDISANQLTIHTNVDNAGKIEQPVPAIKAGSSANMTIKYYPNGWLWVSAQQRTCRFFGADCYNTYPNLNGSGFQTTTQNMSNGVTGMFSLKGDPENNPTLGFAWTGNVGPGQ